jgi:hypothetical protein
MSVHRFIAWIRARLRSSAHPDLSEGMIISTRLRELRDVPKSTPTEMGPTQTQNTVPTQMQNEDHQGRRNRDKFGT